MLKSLLNSVKSLTVKVHCGWSEEISLSYVYCRSSEQEPLFFTWSHDPMTSCRTLSTSSNPNNESDSKWLLILIQKNCISFHLYAKQAELQLIPKHTFSDYMFSVQIRLNRVALGQFKSVCGLHLFIKDLMSKAIISRWYLNKVDLKIKMHYRNLKIFIRSRAGQNTQLCYLSQNIETHGQILL